MISLKNIQRLIAIQRVLVKYGLDEIIKKTHFLRPLRYIFYIFPKKNIKTDSLGRRLRLAFEELGPIFVKFGQVISTRRDLISPDIADELSKLQDQVKPIPSKKIIDQLTKIYGLPLKKIFLKFDSNPLAAASVAQVHGAVLKDGTEVIVKILRPDIQKFIKQDIEMLYFLANLANKYWPRSKNLKPLEIITEYEKTVMN